MRIDSDGSWFMVLARKVSDSREKKVAFLLVDGIESYITSATDTVRSPSIFT
jgi:hypothetical protein